MFDQPVVAFDEQSRRTALPPRPRKKLLVVRRSDGELLLVALVARRLLASHEPRAGNRMLHFGLLVKAVFTICR